MNAAPLPSPAHANKHRWRALAGEEVKEEYMRAGLFNLLSSIIHQYCLVVESDTLVDFERVHNSTVFISDLCFTSPDLDWSLGWFTVSPGEASLQHAVESVFVTAR